MMVSFLAPQMQLMTMPPLQNLLPAVAGLTVMSCLACHEHKPLLGNSRSFAITSYG